MLRIEAVFASMSMGARRISNEEAMANVGKANGLCLEGMESRVEAVCVSGTEQAQLVLSLQFRSTTKLRFGTLRRILRDSKSSTEE